MHLSAIELTNFKPFRSAKITLEARGLALIVGANNVGKSALLSAMDIPLAELTDVRTWGASEPVTAMASFHLDDDDRTAVAAAARCNPAHLLATEALRLVELHYLEHPDGALRLGCVKATSGGGDLDTIGEVTWGAEPNSDRARMVQLPQVLSTQLASAWNSFHEVSGGLSGILTQPGPLSPLLSVISDRWRSRVYKFDVHRQGTQRQRGISSHNALAPSGENLPEVLLDMKTNDERRFDEVASIVADVVPEVGRLVARTNAAHVWVEFEDVVSGRRTNLVDVGTGVQQILLAAVIGCTADRHSLVLLEEPELHLHPGAQRKLLSHLQRWSENVCLLASTHSTIFLDAVAEAGDVWSVERKDGDTTLHNASTTMPDVLENLGVRPADVLGADGLLIVEGPSDRAIMECWMPDLRARNISVQVAGGGDGARQADNLADWFSGLDTLVRPVVFLRDRDELGQHDVDKLQETGRVVVLDRREIENFLLDVDVLSSYLKSRGVAGAEASQISEIIDIACDDLRAVVHLKRVAAQLGPIRLLDRKTVAKIAESSPTRAAVLEVVAQNLPSVTALADVGALWDSESKALADCWSDQRRILAAGSDILERLFSHFGLSYDKARDGMALASRSPTPAEMCDRIRAGLNLPNLA